MITESLPYTLAVGAAALAAGYFAYRLGDLTLATAAGVVGAYALHLLSVRRLRRRFRDARILDRLHAQLEGTVADETLVIRRFPLATVALVEGAMDPGDVFRTLVATDGGSDAGFGDRAVEKGHLSRQELRALMETRREARFLTDQVRVARRKLETFRRENGVTAP